MLHTFHSILHHENDTSNTPLSRSDDDSSKRKKKRIRLSTKTTAHLASVNKFLRKRVRSSHSTNISQVITDKQLQRERRGVSTKKGVDDSSILSKLSSKSIKSNNSSSSSSTSATSNDESGGKRWKMKQICSKNSEDNTKEKNNKNEGTFFPIAIDSEKSKVIDVEKNN